MNKKNKICLAASAGGHLSQLLKIDSCWKVCDNVFCVTTTEVSRKPLEKYGNVSVVGECNHKHPVRVLKVMFRCFRIVMRERPDIIISTGAAAGCMLCFIGKIIGAKVIWIDSITNVKRLSMSGRMVRHIASLFLVQWPELAGKYKNVEYVGTVI